MKVCTIEGCEKKEKAKGFCSAHYARLLKHGDPLYIHIYQKKEPKKCSIEECDNEIMAKGYCVKHYKKWNRYGDPLIENERIKRICTIDGCAVEYYSKGYCQNHYQNFKKHGDPLYADKKRQEIRVCSIDGCEDKRDALGLCVKHYKRFKKYGDPLVVGTNRNPPEFCTVEGCNEKHDSKNFCTKHYNKFRKYGDPLRKAEVISEKERFMKFVEKSENGCWIWKGFKNKKGYGHFRSYDYKNNKPIIAAHRASYKIFNGQLKEGFHVCHQCDNPSCVNPDHLFLGTNLVNVYDKLAKGRAGKLTWEQVAEIRRLHETGKYSYGQIAEKFNVSNKAIGHIVRYVAWKPVTIDLTD